MYITKYEANDDVFYRIGERKPSGSVALKGGVSKPIQEQAKNRFDTMVKKIMSEKVEEPIEEPIVKTASVANVIRQYAVALKEN